MKIIKVIYDADNDYILSILEQVVVNVYVEKYNISNYKEKKKALPIMTRHGTKLTPLLVFEDENLNEYAAIWCESNPDWLAEINKILLND